MLARARNLKKTLSKQEDYLPNGGLKRVNAGTDSKNVCGKVPLRR